MSDDEDTYNEDSEKFDQSFKGESLRNHAKAKEDVVLPEWLVELPEDLEVGHYVLGQLDLFSPFFNTTLEWRFTFFLLFTFQVYIAQREFVQAVDLVLRAQEFCRSHGQESQTVQEASIRLQEKIQHLINVLSGELSTEKSFQGGPRAARNAVQLLCRLGRSTQATDLFLHHRTAIIRSAMK